MYGVRTIGFFGEYRNPTGGQTMVVNLTNGQKQYLPVGTGTSIVLTGPTGPGNYMLRVFHYQPSSVLNWPTGGSAAVWWPGGVMGRGSVASGAIDLIAIYANGSTGPDANQYYAQLAPDFRRT